MSWVCEYCSSANEESRTDCFVCGNPRSAASIRAAKRETRKKHAERAGRRLWRSVNVGGRVAFYASLTLFTVMTVLTIVMKINDMALDDLADMIALMAVHVGTNIKGLFVGKGDGNSFTLVFEELFVGRSTKFAAVGNRIAGLWDCAGAAFRSLGQTVSLLWGQIAERADVAVDRFGRMLHGIRAKF